MKQFWYVVNPNGRKPNHKHFVLGEAIAEAKRMAALHPADNFLIMEAVGGFKGKIKDIEIQQIDFE